MAKKELTVDSEFIVGEEKILVFIVAALFFGFFIYGMVDAILQHFNSGAYIVSLSAFALLPAIFFLKKGMSKHIYIRINKTGIYQDEKLVTRWENFLKAYIDQKEAIFSISDNFVLVVEYLKEGNDKGFRRKIPLTNTQNKSEEDVLAAVMFFWKVDTGIYTIEN